MLRKLLKYEIKASARKFLPLYGAILFFSLIFNLNMQFIKNDTFTGISAIVLASLFIALGVITLMTIIGRFKDNLLSDEGYLMFTLPVSAEKLVLSKVLNSVFWLIASGIASVLAVVLGVVNKELFGLLNELISKYMYYIKQIEIQHIVALITLLVTLLTQAVYIILLIYFSMSVSQFPAFIKHRKAASFIAFVITNSVLSSLVSFLFAQMPVKSPYPFTTEFTFVLVYAIITNLSLSVILFFATTYILKNHLNLE